MSKRQRDGDNISAPPPRPPEPTAIPTVKTSDSTRYRMAEKPAADGEDFFILNEQGQHVYKIDGQAARLLDTLIFQDVKGNDVCRIQHRIARQRNSMEICDADGRTAAIVQKAMISPLRDKFVIRIVDGADLEFQGNILDHEYRIGSVATVSKSRFQVRNIYGVEIIPGQNERSFWPRRFAWTKWSAMSDSVLCRRDIN